MSYHSLGLQGGIVEPKTGGVYKRVQWRYFRGCAWVRPLGRIALSKDASTLVEQARRYRLQSNTARGWAEVLHWV